MKEVSRSAKVAIAAFILVILGYAVLLFIVIQSFATPPVTRPDIEILRNPAMIVPNEVTVGQRFAYRTTGEKMVDAGAEVRLQLACIIDNNQTILTVATYYSGSLKKGKYDVSRNQVILDSPRLATTDQCYLETIASYTFYQVDRFGQQQSITIPVPVRSNTFRLNVPPKELSLENEQSGPAAPATAGSTAENGVPVTTQSTVPHVDDGPPSDPNIPVQALQPPVPTPGILNLKLELRPLSLLDILLGR